MPNSMGGIERSGLNRMGRCRIPVMSSLILSWNGLDTVVRLGNIR